MGPKVRCWPAPRRLVPSSLQAPRDPSLLDPPDVPKSLGARMVTFAAVSRKACLDMNGIERNKSDATTSEDEASTCAKEVPSHRQPHSGNGQAFREESILSGTSRSKELQSLPPGLAVVPPAHLGGKQRARRGHRGRRGTRGFFNEKYRLDYSSSTGDILLGAVCYYFLDYGKHGGHFLPRSHCALQGWGRRTPARSRDPLSFDLTHRESSRSVSLSHVWCVWAALPATRALEHGHLPVVDGDVSLQKGEPLTILR